MPRSVLVWEEGPSVTDGAAEVDPPEEWSAQSAPQVIAPTPLLPRYIAAAIRQAGEHLEDGDIEPSDLARTTCEQHFAQVASRWKQHEPPPLPFCGTAGDGEVFCEWRGPTRRVFVTVYPNGYMRLFWAQLRGQQVAKGATIPRPTPAETAIALAWVGAQAQ